MTRLVPGVYAIEHKVATHSWPEMSTDWPHGNTGVVIGSSCVLVVDATFYPARAEADIALIRRVTDRPVCFLINTHWHGDHTHGNATYKRAFPALEIAGPSDNAGFIEVMQTRYAASFPRERSAPQLELARLRRVLSNGADSAGKSLTPPERAQLQQVIGEYETEVTQVALVRAATVTLRFDREMSFDLGGVVVTAQSRGHGNSPDDVTVVVPASGVMFTGDILVHPVPFAFASYPTHWERVTADLIRESPAIVVPGHGPPMRDLDYLKLVHELLSVVNARARALLLGGALPAEVKQKLNLDDLKARFVAPANIDTVAFWRDSIIDALVDRAIKCVSGVEC